MSRSFNNKTVSIIKV